MPRTHPTPRRSIGADLEELVGAAELRDLVSPPWSDEDVVDPEGP